MARYVKFLRGTPEQYKNLVVKDTDTLYFISAAGDDSAELYLGSKLISSAASGGEGDVTTLA